MPKAKIIKKAGYLIPFIISILLILWLTMLASDYLAVMINLERPLFARAGMTADDGGFGIYRGFGYAFKITGKPGVPQPGVYYGEFYVFGFKINRVTK